MTFKTVKELENHILSCMKPAIEKAQAQIYQVIDRFIKEYYAEFSPELYDRTYQLYRSLVKSEIIFTGKGYKAHVYFDLDALDYSIKTLKKIGTWENTYHRNNWTHENDKAVFELVAHGSHGGYKNGTAIWDEAIAVLNKEAYEILKRMLIESGIPVK